MSDLNRKNSSYLLEMRNIVKEFPGVKALDGVNLKVMPNQIHAICGENGAGKSTLMNVLSGVYPYGTYQGQILFDGAECKFQNIRDSEKKEIAFIHQHMTLIPYLSVAENIFLGNEVTGKYGIDWEKTASEALKVMNLVGLKASTNDLVVNLGIGNQQLVEICKAISKKVRLLILDEPTAALTDEESNNLLQLLVQLKEKGITSILITHKLHEIMQVCDQVTIMRDGKTIETLTKGIDEITEDRVIKGMVGREITQRFPKREPAIGDIYYSVENWNVFDAVRDDRLRINNISFNVRKGEVLGIAGLMGAGRTELAMSLFGHSYGRKITGIVKKENKEINVKTVSSAIKNGIAYVSEDRQVYGLIMTDSLRANITLPNLNQFVKGTSINVDLEMQTADNYRKKLNIKSYSSAQTVNTLSGGNQQKVVFSRWVLAGADLLILDEPTRGIDVGAKYEIYEIINELVSEGKSVILISSDMTELLGMCDRVYVMNDGKIVGELHGKDIRQDAIMKAIMKDERSGGQG